MRTLPIQRVEHDAVIPTAHITLKTGREFYVCNPMPDLREAMDEGVPFEAHSVIGMAPVECVINPAHVALVEGVKA